MEVPVIESSSRRGFNWEGTSWKVWVRRGQRAKTHELSLKLFNSPLCLGQSKWRRCHCICTRPPGTSLLPWLAPSWPPRPRSSASTTSSHYHSSRQTNWPEVRGGGICQRSRGRLGLPGFDRRLSFGGLSTGLPMIPHTQIASSIELKLSHFSGYVPLILLNKCSPSCIP